MPVPDAAGWDKLSMLIKLTGAQGHIRKHLWQFERISTNEICCLPNIEFFVRIGGIGQSKIAIELPMKIL